jgi:DNA-directed RNA polymerase subunit omega
MIEALKSDEIVNKIGGRFKLTALIQKRMMELMDGARPLVERGGLTDLETVVQEILQDKITIDYEASGIPRPEEAKAAGRARGEPAAKKGDWFWSCLLTLRMTTLLRMPR